MSENADTTADVGGDWVTVTVMVTAAFLTGLGIGVATTSVHAGKSYADCVLRNLDSVHADQAALALVGACRNAYR